LALLTGEPAGYRSATAARDFRLASNEAAKRNVLTYQCWILF
jgi:hypothetical protein